ncbi:unnamed protein product, partial [marine sediment metagenome]
MFAFYLVGGNVFSLKNFKDRREHLDHPFFGAHTHWKAFYRDKHELKFKWEIKFIKEKVQAKRGRPRNSDKIKNKNVKWRQKLENYQSDSFKKEGTAKIYVNFRTNKLSM